MPMQQTKINENLTKQHKALMKEELSLKLALERVITMERDTCNKLQEDGAKELAKAKANWLYSEKNEFRKREQKLIPKIKREAAKMVELKLGSSQRMLLLVHFFYIYVFIAILV